MGLERAKRIAPHNEELRRQLREVYERIGEGRELAALILEDAARATDPVTRFAHLVRAGRLMLDAEGGAERAIPVLEEAKNLRPDDGEAMLLLADAYTLTGRLHEARAVLDAAVVASKGRRTKVLAAVHRRLARLDHAAGDSVAALAALSRAFDSDPQNAQLAMELGGLAVALDQPEPATRAFRAVTMMKPAPVGSPEGATGPDPRPRLLPPRPHGLHPGGPAEGAAHDRQGRRRRSHARGGPRSPRSAPGLVSEVRSPPSRAP